MRLYTSPSTPFGRKVAVVIHEAGLLEQVEWVKVAGNAVDPGTMPLESNPLGKIPVLIANDGRVLYDSRVICRYLADLALPSLYPTGPRLWDTLTLEAAADGVMDAGILMVYEGRVRPEELRYAPWVEGQWAKITRTLDMIEANCVAQLAEPLDAAQIALGCMAGHLDLRHGARNWRDGHPQLAEWEAGFALRPAMQATKPLAQ